MGGVPGGTGVLVVDLLLEQHRWFAKQGFEHVVHPPLGQELMQGRVILGEVFGSRFDPATVCAFEVVATQCRCVGDVVNPSQQLSHGVACHQAGHMHDAVLLMTPLEFQEILRIPVRCGCGVAHLIGVRVDSTSALRLRAAVMAMSSRMD